MTNLGKSSDIAIDVRGKLKASNLFKRRRLIFNSFSDLNEQVIQELLWIPPNIEVKKAQCNRLGINIQWTKLSKSPIVISLDKIILSVSEPTEIQPMPNLLALIQSKYVL